MGTPLVRKLDVKAGHRVLLVGAPADLDLEPLPPGATLHRRRGRGTYDVVVVFCPDRAELVRRLPPLLAALGPASAVWVCWPKRASGVPTDLDDNVVREHGLDLGVVDVKVCAVDASWSGLKFVYRLSDRPKVSSTQA